MQENISEIARALFETPSPAAWVLVGDGAEAVAEFLASCGFHVLPPLTDVEPISRFEGLAELIWRTLHWMSYVSEGGSTITLRGPVDLYVRQGASGPFWVEPTLREAGVPVRYISVGVGVEHSTSIMARRATVDVQDVLAKRGEDEVTLYARIARAFTKT